MTNQEEDLWELKPIMQAVMIGSRKEIVAFQAKPTMGEAYVAEFLQWTSMRLTTKWHTWARTLSGRLWLAMVSS